MCIRDSARAEPQSAGLIDESDTGLGGDDRYWLRTLHLNLHPQCQRVAYTSTTMRYDTVSFNICLNNNNNGLKIIKLKNEK